MLALFTALAIAAAPAPASAADQHQDHASHEGMDHSKMKHDAPCCDEQAKKDCCKDDKAMPCCEKMKGDASAAESGAGHNHDH